MAKSISDVISAVHRTTANCNRLECHRDRFSSIGHLHACGVNLPLLSYYDLIGIDGPKNIYNRQVQHKFWVDFNRDFWSFAAKRKNNQLSTIEWARSLLKCRCSAYWQWRDPGRGLYRGYLLSKKLMSSLKKKLFNLMPKF